MQFFRVLIFEIKHVLLIFLIGASTAALSAGESVRQTGRAARLQWAAGQLRQPLPAGEATEGCRAAARSP